MPDMNISVAIEADATPFEQGIVRAEQLLRRLSEGMTSAAEQVQQQSSQVAAAWQGINNSILQAVERANQLTILSGLTAAPSASASALNGEALAQTVASALSGVAVQLDGEAVGSLVAPIVNRSIAVSAHERRFALK